MRKLVYGVLGAAALAMASAASAQVSIIDPTTINGPGVPVGDGFNFTFGYSDSNGAVNPFEQLVSFSSTMDGYFGLGVQTTATSVDGVSDVDFSNVWLTTLCPNAGATAVPGTCGATTLITALDNNSESDLHEDWGLSNLFLAAGDYTLHIAGTRGRVSSFDGNISFQAASVPEPATWAMMLFGFGAIGWQLRRRRAPILAQAA